MPKRRKSLDPHKITGIIVIYGLAVDGVVRFLTWLFFNLVHDISPFLRL